MQINENRTYCSFRAPRIVCYLSSNKPISYLNTYISRYAKSLSANYLFVEGDKDITYMNVDNYGFFYVVFIFFYLAGLLSLANRIIKFKLTQIDLLLIAGLFISPLPSILAGDPQKVRLSPLFPFVMLTMVYGAQLFDDLIKRAYFKKIYYASLAFLSIGFALFFMINFITVHTNKHEITYGTHVPKLMKYLAQQDKNTKIYITSMTEAIIFYAFVNKVDPNIYQTTVVRSHPDKIGFAQPIKLGNILIADHDIQRAYCTSLKNDEKALYVTNEDFRGTLGKEQKIIWSENGVHTLAFIYDLKTLNLSTLGCKK